MLLAIILTLADSHFHWLKAACALLQHTRTDANRRFSQPYYYVEKETLLCFGAV